MRPNPALAPWVRHKRKGADEDELVQLTRKEATAEATRGWKQLSNVDRIEWKWKAQEMYNEMAGPEFLVHRTPHFD